MTPRTQRTCRSDKPKGLALTPDRRNEARLRGLERLQDVGYQWAKVGHSVGRCHDHDDRKGNAVHALLVRQATIHREKSPMGGRRPSEKLTVLDARPAETCYRVRIVAYQQLRKVVRQVLVKKDAHQPAPSLWPARARQSLARA